MSSQNTFPQARPIPAAPAVRRHSYQPMAAPAPTAPALAQWPPLSVSYPPPTPMAPRVHTVPLPAETPAYNPRELPSPALTPSPLLPAVQAPQMRRYSNSPRSAPAVLPMPGLQAWPSPAVHPRPYTSAGHTPPASAPIHIPSRRPHGHGLTIVQPPTPRLGPVSAGDYYPSSAARYSPIPLPTEVDLREALIIPSSPASQAYPHRSHAPVSLALNSAHPITYASHTYTTAEHLVEAMKFKYHPEIAAEIRVSPDPAQTADQYGQYVRLDWESRKAAKVDEVVRMKYLQNPEIVLELLGTGDRYLVDEADTQWNHLGGALMRLRREYRRRGEGNVG